MEISEKLKTFFFAVLKYTYNLKLFEKKDEPHSLSILEIKDSERHDYLNV